VRFTDYPRLLEKFETKHGSHDDLLDAVCRLPGGPHAVLTSAQRAEKSRLEWLLRRHDRLIVGVLGYSAGIQSAVEALRVAGMNDAAKILEDL
jgi:epoxyqueuosine reductase QueG